MIHIDCRHYRTAHPCLPNKREGAECPTCLYYTPFHDRVLVIKLDALGDVLRTSSLLPAIVAKHDHPYVAWLTRPGAAAEIVRMVPLVDECIELTPEGVARVSAGGWTKIYSLSNDLPSAALATAAAGNGRYDVVIGYDLVSGLIRPTNDAARRWLELAAFDRLKHENTLTWQQHMLAIIGSDQPPARPCLGVVPARRSRFRDGHPVIAIVVGTGSRWPKKMLDEVQIIDLIEAVEHCRPDADIVLIGGPAEREKAGRIVLRTGINMQITDTIPSLVDALAQVDVLVCGDTLAMHIATAIGLRAVVLFGPTSVNEIETYGLLDKIATPELDCLGCYGDCDKRNNCMSVLAPVMVAEHVVTLLKKAGF